MIIRDLHLFNEGYPSRYYDQILVEKESIFDPFPVLNAHQFSSIDPVKERVFVSNDYLLHQYEIDRNLPNYKCNPS